MEAKWGFWLLVGFFLGLCVAIIINHFLIPHTITQVCDIPAQNLSGVVIP
jgi:hypothetical protein